MLCWGSPGVPKLGFSHELEDHMWVRFPLEKTSSFSSKASSSSSFWKARTYSRGSRAGSPHYLESPPLPGASPCGLALLKESFLCLVSVGSLPAFQGNSAPCQAACVCITKQSSMFSRKRRGKHPRAWQGPQPGAGAEKQLG